MTAHLARLPGKSPAEAGLIPKSKRFGLGTCSGSFGELVQGQDLTDHFLVTCPINAEARAVFRINSPSSDVQVVPTRKTKTARFASQLVRQLGLCGGLLTLSSELREGAGCASSSADMVAAARAIGHAFGIKLPMPLVERLMLGIEPTDGVMYSGSTLYRFRSSGFEQSLGPLPPMAIVALDEGGVVDTLGVERHRRSYDRPQRLEFELLLATLKRAISGQRIDEIGRVSTRSAKINEARLPKRNLSAMLGIVDTVDAPGLIATHSGNGIGVILDPSSADFAETVAETVSRASQLNGEVSIYHTCSPS